MARKAVLEKNIVAADGVGNPRSLADCAGGRPRLFGLAAENHLLHARFDFVGQLEAVPGKKLDAVVLIGIMRRGNHHAGVGAHAAGEKRHAGRRHRTDQQHVGAHGNDARGQRGLQHVTRQPGILADKNLDSDACRSRRCGARTTATACGPGRSRFDSCNTLAMARPSLSAISEVIGS